MFKALSLAEEIPDSILAKINPDLPTEYPK